MTEPTYSENIWSNVSHALATHRRRLLRRVETGVASQGQRDMVRDLDFVIRAIEEGRVTIR